MFASVKEADTVTHNYSLQYPLITLNSNGQIPLDASGKIMYDAVKVSNAETYSQLKDDSNAQHLVLKAKKAIGVDHIDSVIVKSKIASGGEEIHHSWF